MLGWHQSLRGLPLAGRGNQALLAQPMSAFFASRQCPGIAIRLGMEWALQQARAKACVVSGFHSPLEQSVLKVLTVASSPVVIVLARPVEGASLRPEWLEPLMQGRMAVVSVATVSTRLTDEVASERNMAAAQIANTIVLAYASPGGALARLHQQWLATKREMTVLA